MAKSHNQKLKILYLMELFLQKSDVNHVLSIKEMVEYLSERGILAERKSIYDDIEVLKTFGLKILNRRERPAGYYLAERTFTREDCCLLINMVQSSEEITNRKARELTKKIEEIAPKTEGIVAAGNIDTPNRIKLMEESPYAVIDVVRKAMDQDVKITFRQVHLTKSQETIFHRYGSTIVFSPWRIIYEEGHYEIEGMEDGKLGNYQLDKISYLNILDEKREALS